MKRTMMARLRRSIIHHSASHQNGGWVERRRRAIIKVDHERCIFRRVQSRIFAENSNILFGMTVSGDALMVEIVNNLADVTKNFLSEHWE